MLFAGTGAALSGSWDVAFLLLSGLLVGLATRRMSSAGLRGALWGFFGLFGAAVLLKGRWPGIEAAQYAASAGLIATHLLNLRHCRRCTARQCPAQPAAQA